VSSPQPPSPSDEASEAVRAIAGLSRGDAQYAQGDNDTTGDTSGENSIDLEETYAGVDIATPPPILDDTSPESRAPRSIPPASASAPASGRDVVELEAQIRALEARIDAMLKSQDSDASARDDLPPASHAPASKRIESEPPRERVRYDEDDPFGYDPAYEARLLSAIDVVYSTYFRIEATGVEHIPSTGRCLLVANHTGGPVPYDGLMLRAMVRREHESKRSLRWLVEDFVHHLPFVGTAMSRLGAVRACQENAERLLRREELVAVFPEGRKGLGKPSGERYRLQRFGRGGFVRLALRTGTPIIPCALVGAEEGNPIFARLDAAAKRFGVPSLPTTAAFPLLGPIGLVPAPTKWTIALGEPIRLHDYGPDAEGDDVLVARLAEGVREVVQIMVDGLVARRSQSW
jgi:1-acyl-sn-glycerol-3-phosphate acyltransferase